MIQGGVDRADIRPLDHQGNYIKGARGNHRAHSSALNVYNAQPGYVYYWQRNDYDSLLASSHYGWEVVPPGAPERMGPENNPLFGAGVALDGVNVRRDVVLMRMPEARYRVYKEEKQQAALRALYGNTDAYLTEGQKAQRRYGASAGGPIYYRGPGHSTNVESGT